MDTKEFQLFQDKIVNNCSKIFIGKKEVITKVTICLVCSGHVLLEDIPGTGKTILFRAFSKSIGGKFKRIQFTPDLMPSDLTGINFYNMKECEFEFREGPLFANFILADEINRAMPRTQSSLLEAMAEKQITVDGKTYLLKEPFMVAATENPLESSGTFALPEAQLDRFMMRLSLGYMNREDEVEVITQAYKTNRLNDLKYVVSVDDILQLRQKFHEVKVSEEVIHYLMDIIELTRTKEEFIKGASTRGAIALYQAAQVWAAMQGRDYCIPEDVKELASDILVHRLSFRDFLGKEEAETVFAKLLDQVPVPMEQPPYAKES